MSTTMVGPLLSLDGPLPVEPRHSLLNTPGVVVDRDVGRWLNGANVWGYPDDCPSLWEPCAEGTFRTKAEGDAGPTARFDPFVVYLPITCSMISVGNPVEFSGRASRVLDATLSAGVEEALASGTGGGSSNSPFFGDANVSVLAGGAAVSAGVGLSYLEEAIGATCRAGVIHATPAVVAALEAFPLGDDLRNLETANGTPVVSGDGYQGVDTPWLAAPGDTQDWVFATGPVHVYLGPLVMTDIKETLDRSDNSVTFRAERYVLAVWDTVLQAAVLVDWAT